MREKPILFNGEMVRAILEGRKSQTRRLPYVQIPDGATDLELCSPVGNCFGRENNDRFGVMYKEPKRSWLANDKPLYGFIPCKYGQVGDRLWVRETWSCVKTRRIDLSEDQDTVYYECDRSFKYVEPWIKSQKDGKPIKWKPSIHMPRWASRITLEITDIRVERLNDISEEDAVLEGIKASCRCGGGFGYYPVATPDSGKEELDEMKIFKDIKEIVERYDTSEIFDINLMSSEIKDYIRDLKSPQVLSVEEIKNVLDNIPSTHIPIQKINGKLYFYMNKQEIFQAIFDAQKWK